MWSGSKLSLSDKKLSVIVKIENRQCKIAIAIKNEPKLFPVFMSVVCVALKYDCL